MSAIGLSFLTNGRRPALIGMIHVGALPGTPCSSQTVTTIAAQAVAEAKLLADGGADAVILENMHDVPYLNRGVGPEIVSAMTAVCTAVRAAVTLPLGVQVLAGANREAIAVAHAAACQFVRCEGFVFAHVADEGLMPQADAGPLLRYRRAIGAQSVAIAADIKKKHASHAITADVDLADSARTAEFFGADAVVVTGSATGQPTAPADLAAAAGAVAIPVFVGSGVTPQNVPSLADADALVVGSFIKREGRWANPPDPARLARLRAAIDALPDR
jgi:hypothetical protein